jgi:hypothetical protein
MITPRPSEQIRRRRIKKYKENKVVYHLESLADILERNRKSHPRETELAVGRWKGVLNEMYAAAANASDNERTYIKALYHQLRNFDELTAEGRLAAAKEYYAEDVIRENMSPEGRQRRWLKEEQAKQQPQTGTVI